MRMTFGSVAAISVLVLMTSALWPDGRRGPSPKQVTAQDKVKKHERDRAPLLSPALGDADLRVEENLKKRIDVEYVEVPFAEALEELEANSELQFYVKVRYLEDLGLSTDEPVTLNLEDVSVETVLDLMLENLYLTYVVRDGVVLITTEEDFENVAEVRVYNCRDLLEAYVGYDDESEASENVEPGYYAPEPAPPAEKKNNRGGKKKKSEDKLSTIESRHGSWFAKDVLAQFGGGGQMYGGGGMAVPPKPQSREDQLINIITIAVSPESWEQFGGAGTIGEFDGMIVIRQNPRAHRQVEETLDMLRDASGQQAWENPESRRGYPGQGGFGSGGGGGFF